MSAKASVKTDAAKVEYVVQILVGDPPGGPYRPFGWVGDVFVLANYDTGLIAYKRSDMIAAYEKTFARRRANCSRTEYIWGCLDGRNQIADDPDDEALIKESDAR